LPAQQTCDDDCVTLDNDPNHCGRCNTQCALGQACTDGRCVGSPPATGDTLRIQSLGTTGCNVVLHNGVTGDDRGGIAVSGTHVYTTGDTATGRFDPVTLGGATRVGATHNGLVHDIASGALYNLGTGPTTGMPSSGTFTLTHLLELDGATGASTGRAVRLSLIIPVSAGSPTLGIFSGMGRVLVWSVGQLFDIALPSGVVTLRGPLPAQTWYPCESIAVWGVAESFDGRLYLTYRSATMGGHSIVRTDIATGLTTPVATFTNLADLCGFTVSPSRNRWYFHHEGASQFTIQGTLDEVLGTCDATFGASTGPTPTGPTFRVDALTTGSCLTAQNTSAQGDDRGGLALGSLLLFSTGDTGTARHNVDDLRAFSNTSQQLDGLFSDLATQRVYVFAPGPSGRLQGPSLDGVTVTHLVPLDPNNGTPLPGSAITLSQPLTFTGNAQGPSVGIFSGRGRVVVHTLGRVYDIALPSGTVTDFGTMPAPAFQRCEGYGVWGVAEHFGGRLYLTHRAANTHTIVRTRVPDGATTTVGTFGNLGDLCSFTVSPQRRRWYFQHEGISQFVSSTGEVVGECTAVTSTP